MSKFRTVAAGVALAIAMTAGSAATAQAPSAYDKAVLAELSPDLRKQVEARMTGGQTVRGILETMLLNNISKKFAYNQVVAIDFDEEIIVVSDGKGKVRAYAFDVTTLVVDTNSTPKPVATN